MKKLYLFILSSFLTTTFAFAGGACTGNATNTTCASSTPLTPGAACVNGTTCGGGSGVAASCFTGSTCSWYSFTATGTNMYVNIDVTATGGCYIRSNVFSRSGACSGLTDISCQIGAPIDDSHSLTGLTVGATYYVQVCYAGGGPCGDGANFCINVAEPDPPCGVCSTPCGTATGFATAPTIQQVVDACQTSPLVPELSTGDTKTFCYSFQATNATVNFSVVITSTCGSGNVSTFSWSLYNSPSCGAAIQTGTLASLTFTGLTVGNNYVFCYTFTVPFASSPSPPGTPCTHSQHCPYFVGATVLPITLSHFDAKYNPETIAVELDWATVSEINNEFFTVEKSVDGVTFEVVSIVKGAGNSSAFQDYNSLDKNPYYGTSYYRLKQTDFDGQFEYFNMVPVKVEKEISDITIYPNPVSGNGTLSLSVAEKGITTIVIYDIAGRQVYAKNHNTNKGNNTISLETNQFSNGMYFISIANGNAKENLKFIKE